MEIGTAGIDASAYRLVPVTNEFGAFPPQFPEKWWRLYYGIALAQDLESGSCGFLSVDPSFKDTARNLERPIRRWEMAELIADVYRLPLGEYDTPLGLPNPYADLEVRVRLHEGSAIPVPVEDTPEAWSAMTYSLGARPRNAILRLTADGVLSGDTVPGTTKRTFRPIDTLSRAEAVKILLKARATYPADSAARPTGTELQDALPLPCTA